MTYGMVVGIHIEEVTCSYRKLCGLTNHPLTVTNSGPAGPPVAYSPST